MDAKCYITTCELLTISTGVLNELAYGIDCEMVKYCNFAQFYIEVDLQEIPLINEDEDWYDTVDDDEIEGTVPDIPYSEDGDDSTDSTDDDGLNDGDGTVVVIGTLAVSVEYTDFVCQQIIPDESTTTTTTTTVGGCFLDFNATGEIDGSYTTTTSTTTTTTSTTTTTTTTLPDALCDVQVDVLEITW